MIFDADKGFVPPGAPYDVCIVGAGAAGLTLALQLRTAALRVCLLEAGGEGYESAVQAMFGGEVDGRYPPLRDTRMGALGGTTNVWAGWCRPLDAIDFRDGADDDWPFGSEELTPYYVRAHDVCGLGRFEYDPDAWRPVLGEDPLRAEAGPFATQIFLINRRRFGQRFRDDLARAKNVDLVLHAAVTGIVRRPAGDVRGVAVSVAGGTSFPVAAKAVVLAAGGIENPRLLLLSGDTEGQVPGNAGGLVGRYFNDHAFVDPGTVVFRERRDLRFYLPAAVPDEAGDAFVRGVLAPAETLLKRERLPNAALFFYPRYEAHRAYQSAAVKALLQVWAKARGHAVPGNVRPYLAQAAGAPHLAVMALARKLSVRHAPARRWRMRAMFECEPRYENRVTLSDAPDRLGRRLPRVAWSPGEQALARMSRLLGLFDAHLRNAAIGRLERAFPDEPSAWGAAVEGGKHHMGTTRMHADPLRGVVDADCRVHGTPNLYVAGSSVFPRGGYANPTLTIVALAIRLADRLRRAV